MWNLENGTDEPICKAGIETAENGRINTVERDGGMRWVIGTDIYMPPCVK